MMSVIYGFTDLKCVAGKGKGSRHTPPYFLILLIPTDSNVHSRTDVIDRGVFGPSKKKVGAFDNATPNLF